MMREIRLGRVTAGNPSAASALLAYMTELADRGVWRGDPDPAEDADGFDPPEGVFIVAEDGDRVVGAAGLRRLDDDVCEVKRMWVHPEHRRAGIAGAILAELMRFARERGYETVRLDTNAELAEAVSFYEGQGFTQIDRYNDNADATHFFERKTELGQA